MLIIKYCSTVMQGKRKLCECNTRFFLVMHSFQRLLIERGLWALRFLQSGLAVFSYVTIFWLSIFSSNYERTNFTCSMIPTSLYCCILYHEISESILMKCEKQYIFLLSKHLRPNSRSTSGTRQNALCPGGLIHMSSIESACIRKNCVWNVLHN